MQRLLDDMRFGLRLLWRAPVWTIVLSAIMALGIGVSTAIFSLIYSILLHGLPYPNQDRLVSLWSTSSRRSAASVARFNVSAANWVDWRTESRSFQEIMLSRLVADLALTVEGPPQRVRGVRTSANLPQVLGIQPKYGRYFTEHESLQDAKLAVISYGFWNQHFARDGGAVGRTILLNGQSYQVIGIMPADFAYPTKDFDVWLPLFLPPAEINSRMGYFYHSLGRLKPGVSLGQAKEEMSEIMRELAQKYPDSNGLHELGVLVEPMLDTTLGQFRTILYVLIAAVSCLLLIGCTNLEGC